MLKKAILTLAALGIVGTGFGQVAKSGGGYTIKVKYQPGATYNYALNTSVKMMQAMPGVPPGGQQMAMKLQQKCISVANGIATLKVSTSGIPGRAASAPQTIKVDSHGKIVSGKSQSMNLLNGFPSKALRIGESWKATTALPGIPGGAKANVVYTFKGLSSVGGRALARIDYTISMAGQFAMAGTGSSLLDASNGQLYSSSLNGRMSMNPPAGAGRPSKPMVMMLTVSMKRA